MSQPEPPPRQILSAAADLYQRLRGRMQLSAAHRRRKKNAEDTNATEPFGPHRDPRAVGAVLGEITRDLGWDQVLAQSDVISAWPEVVGPDVAANTSPEEIVEGVLRVTCSSTAWATQLRVLSSDILTRLMEAIPEANLLSVQFRGPAQPSWKHGVRTVPGRGPRDTYG